MPFSGLYLLTGLTQGGAVERRRVHRCPPSVTLEPPGPRSGSRRPRRYAIASMGASPDRARCSRAPSTANRRRDSTFGAGAPRGVARFSSPTGVRRPDATCAFRMHGRVQRARSGRRSGRAQLLRALAHAMTTARLPPRTGTLRTALTSTLPSPTPFRGIRGAGAAASSAACAALRPRALCANAAMPRRYWSQCWRFPTAIALASMPPGNTGGHVVLEAVVGDRVGDAGRALGGGNLVDVHQRGLVVGLVPDLGRRSGRAARASPRRRCPTRSRHIASANPHIAYFAALYAASFAIGMRPPMLDTNMICPRPRSSMLRQHREAHAHGGVEVDVHHVLHVGGRELGDTACASGSRRCSRARRARRTRPTLRARPARPRSRSPRSAAQMRDSGACARHRSSTSSSRSARRATMPTVAPRSARIGASAAPMPDDAPVTRIFAPSIFTSVLPLGLRRATRARPRRRCPSTSSTPRRGRGRRTPRPAPRARPASSGAACAASSARWPARRRSPAAATSAARRRAGPRRRRASAISRASAAAGAGLRCDGSPSYQPP